MSVLWINHNGEPTRSSTNELREAVARGATCSAQVEEAVLGLDVALPGAGWLGRVFGPRVPAKLVLIKRVSPDGAEALVEADGRRRWTTMDNIYKIHLFS